MNCAIRDMLDILAQCNRPKPIPTCTSSLGFSLLYIVYTHVIIHCNTSFYTTFLHNKNVTLKGFLCRRMSTKLNHVILVFSVFLFYVISSTSTLAYITWYTHHIANIFNVQSLLACSTSCMTNM